MSTVTQGHSKITFLADLIFAYSFSIITSTPLQMTNIEALTSFIALGGILSSVLGFIQPFERLIHLVIRIKLKDYVPSAKVIRQAFNTRFLDNQKIKLKVGIYLAITLAIILFKPENLGWIDRTSSFIVIFTILVFIVIIMIIEFSKFASCLLIVSMYHAVIRQGGGHPLLDRNTAQHAIDSARRGLESGNWQEVFTWIESIFGIPEGYRVPEDIIGDEEMFIHNNEE